MVTCQNGHTCESFLASLRAQTTEENGKKIKKKGVLHTLRGCSLWRSEKKKITRKKKPFFSRSERMPVSEVAQRSVCT